MRLIDADELIKLIDKREKWVIELIYELQTAYHIDKVVEELEKELSLADKEKERCTAENNLQFDTAKGYASGLSAAIEIVTQGCVASDDVCEWEFDYKFISDKYKRVTGCGHEFYDLHHAVPFKYCPYCGKKIKVGGKNDGE